MSVSANRNALNIADFLPMRCALNAKGVVCLARTHKRDPFDGVVVPYVEEVEMPRRGPREAVFSTLKGKAMRRVVDAGDVASDAPLMVVSNSGRPNVRERKPVIFGKPDRRAVDRSRVSEYVR